MVFFKFKKVPIDINSLSVILLIKLGASKFLVFWENLLSKNILGNRVLASNWSLFCPCSQSFGSSKASTFSFLHLYSSNKNLSCNFQISQYIYKKPYNEVCILTIFVIKKYTMKCASFTSCWFAWDLGYSLLFFNVCYLPKELREVLLTLTLPISY